MGGTWKVGSSTYLLGKIGVRMISNLNVVATK